MCGLHLTNKGEYIMTTSKQNKKAITANELIIDSETVTNTDMATDIEVTISEVSRSKIIDAVEASGNTDAKWVDMAKSLHTNDGITSFMLDSDNKGNYERLHSDIKNAIAVGFKTRKLPSDYQHDTIRHACDVLVLASKELTKDFNDFEKRARKYLQQQIGSIFNKVRNHVIGLEPKEKKVTIKKTANEKAIINGDTFVDSLKEASFSNCEKYIKTITAILAKMKLEELKIEEENS